MRSLALAAMAAALLAAPCAAGGLTPTGAVTLDSTGAPRMTFSNNETIAFRQRVNNSHASTNRILFSFQVLAPSGGAVFAQTGNQVPGTIGNSQSEIAGVTISGFYTVPGIYTLKAIANLDGQIIAQTATFTISSPNVILTYPPNGAQNLTDSPLTFQWVASGAAVYTVTVGNSPSFFNSLFTQNASPGQSSLSYPVNPANSLERLSSGQIYYWRVQAFDNNGNMIGQSNPPSSFSVATQALTRDLAVTSLAIAGAADAQGNIPFVVTVKDQGGTTESSVPLTCALAGLTANGSPATIASIAPNGTMSFSFSAALPPGQASGLAVACLQFFDDLMANNCQTLNVSAAATAPGGGGLLGPGVGAPSPAQIWQQIESLLQAQGIDLSQYQLTSMEGTLTADQLAALLDALRQGQAQVLLSGPPLSAPAAPVSPTPPAFSTGTAAAPESSLPTEAPTASTSAAAASPPDGAQWSGIAPPLYDKFTAFTVKDDSAWQRLWPQFSSDPVPPVDFGRFSVIAIFAGKFDKTTDIDILDVRRSGSGMTVRYAVSGAQAEGTENEEGRSVVPYLLRVAPRTGRDARFVEAKENSHEKP